MIINQTTPRTMIEAMRQAPRPTTLLQDLTGVNSRIRRHNTKYIEIDKVFGDQLIATYVARNGKAKPLGKKGYENHIHLAPYLKTIFTMTDEDTEVRDPGTTVYDGIGSFTPKLAEGLNVMRDRFMRVDEQQLATALNTGAIAVSGEGVSYTISFDQDAGHLITLTGTDVWTNAASTPAANLRTWSQLPIRKGAPSPSWMVGDVDAIVAFAEHADITGKLDNRRIEQGQIDPEQLELQNATYYGTWKDAGVFLDLYTYQGFYETTDGSTVTKVNYMPAGTVFLGSRNADVRKHYCKISNTKARDLNFFADEFPLMIEPDDGSSISVQLESSRMIGLHQPNAFVRAKVLA